MKAILKDITNSVLEFIYPQFCSICGESINISNEFYICRKCFNSIPMAPDSSAIENELIQNIGNEDLCISAAYCLFSKDDGYPFINVIYKLKYGGFKSIGYSYGLELGKIVLDSSEVYYDFVVPVPIHISKKRERTYNQADGIAISVAKVLSTESSLKLCRRKKYTQSQTTLSVGDRKNNVRGIYEVMDKSAIRGKRILVVDEVMTTGSTINALAETLLEAGALRVDAASILRA